MRLEIERNFTSVLFAVLLVGGLWAQDSATPKP